ncbi:lipocalin family protein [Asticcacaulis sp. 201]|uniref:lipocalin family protein n=1 Tax=Asticcacaulis sp. 201 TaxID=3028787 RepID=UPI002917046C|nr:lipocalin family protein [Asticcacaulis sp. 201]MDV6331469.1 lipocalin family protein [Asticcacaulis sp. 201]
MLRYLTIGAALLLSSCASMPAPDTAPKTVAIPMSHYSGTWLEIARRPMWLTNGCVAGYTTYGTGQTPGEVTVEDGCHTDTPTGKLKTIKGKGTLTDAGGDNARLRVQYPFFITWNYWVLYEAPDHSWFISADPAMKNLWVYARAVPSPQDRAVMVAKAKALGYDVTKLEFPAF